MPRRSSGPFRYANLSTESEFQKSVTDMADRLGWIWHHETDSIKSRPGFPDLVLVHPERGVLWLELKSHEGRVRKEQHQWIALLQAAGQRAYVVRPSDLDAIERVLLGEV